MPSLQTSVRLGVDIGGTFTDLVGVAPGGLIATRKLSSTTADYSLAILEGLLEICDDLGVPPGSLDAVVHGTTVATNAILEGRGARTALLTTRGFRDVLELRRIRIPRLYDLAYEKPPPLVPRRLRFELDERLGPRGEVRTPLDSASVERAIEALRAGGVESVAICLLHSYANSAHERHAHALVSSALPGIHVSCSVDVLPEIREYERTSTTVIDAYVGPVVTRYLGALQEKLDRAGVTAPLLVMQSDGGIMSASAACQRPAQIVESGPAAGVVAAARLAARTGDDGIITLDMGGTTTKAAMVESGAIGRTSDYEVGGGISLSSLLVKGGGYALKLPVVDVSEIGAGGGSLVWIDAAGHPHVGPRSAGAVPGPVCYDAGGEEPTLTDVHLALGYLNPTALAGGRVRLNQDKARRALIERIADPMGLSVLDAAHGVYRIAVATMTRAVKAVSTFRGRDPRDFALLAFGGSGPIVAVELARALQMRRVLVPPAAGLFSAFGLLVADVEQQFVQTFLRPAGQLALEDLATAFRTLESRAATAFERASPDAAAPVVSRSVDLRYSGQAYELTVPVPNGALDPEAVSGLVEAFEAEHLRTYGHRATGEPVDLVNLRVSCRSPTAGLDAAQLTRAAAAAVRRPAVASARPAYFGPEVGVVDTPVLGTRHELGRDGRAGPLIVEEYDTTCVVPPGSHAALDAWGTIVITVAEPPVESR